MIYKNPIKYLLILALGFFALQSHGNKADEVFVYLEAIDSFNGNPVNAEYRVQSIKSGNSYTLKEEDGRKYFELRPGDEVKVKVILDGYYPEEKNIFHDELTADEEQVTFKLRQRPTAVLELSAIEPERQRKNPAEFEVYFGNKLIGKGNTTKNVPVYTVYVTESGEYTILAKGDGFVQNEYKASVEVSTPTNKVSKVVELTKASQEVLVSFIDEQYGKPAKLAISVTEKGSERVLYDDEPGNGMFKFKFESGKVYTIKAQGKGFKDFTKEITGPITENQGFTVRTVTIVEFVTLDASNKRPIDALISLLSPSGKSVKVEDGNTFLPEEKGNYKVEVSSNGYMPKNGTIMVNNFTGGLMQFSFELEEADQQYRIKVIDHYSKELLKEVDFKVFSQAGMQLKGILPTKEFSWNFMTDNDAKYFIEASAEGYSDFTKNLKEEREFEVELFWKPELTYAIFLKDELSREVVDNVDLKILNSKGQEIFVYKTKDQGKYLARMYKNENYSYLISSGLYEENISSMTNLGNNEQELLLKKKGTEEILIAFQDEITGQEISPDYRVGLNGKPISVSNNILAVEKDQTYTLKAILKNYETKSIDNLEQLASDGKALVKMKRESYPIQVMIQNFKSPESFNDINVNMEQKGGTSVRSWFEKEGLYYEAYVKSDQDYVVNIRKEGFENFTKTFRLTELTKKGPSVFNLSVTLTEIEKTPPPPKPTIVEKPEVKEEVTADIQEILSKIPSDQRALAKELTDKASLGKRYFLDQVNFKKGSPIIADDIVLQLNNIALSLKEHPQVKIEIVGHTDNVGDPRANLGLSRFRAKAVANYLFNKGADPNMIIVKGKGEEEPIASNDTEENKAKNRRVEMILLAN